MVVACENCIAFFQQALKRALEEGLFFPLLSDRARGEWKGAGHAKEVSSKGEGRGRAPTPPISHRLGPGEEFLT